MIDTWNHLYFDRSICSIQNDGFPWAKIIIPMPTGEYQDYHVEHSFSNAGKHTNYFWIRYPKDYIFQLIKTDREPGTRHKRIKLTAGEFETVFKEMNDRLHRRTNIWLAELMEYDFDKHGIEWSRTKRWALGSVEGCWFYLDEDDKRLISAKTFRLIKPMSEADVQQYKQFTAAVRTIHNEVFETTRIVEAIEVHCKYKEYGQVVAAAKEQFLQTCRQEIANQEQRLKMLNDQFENSIKEFAEITLPEEIQAQIDKANTKKERKIDFITLKQPLEIIKETEKAIQVHPESSQIPNGIWLPKAWVQFSDNNKEVIAITKKAEKKLVE